ncbi:hypothetical protein [Paenibacillus sp. SYP-B4298]|uniref:hypothetical protein n=1 Tax=Paenibacillus sp. SYP-B4298 TaxID=2996034 RepID=UPI0022DE065F|nr:hypothetical protein [Paenibacillus sp. SYP-B4298]
MRYPFTLIAILFSIALCLFSYSGYDPHNMIFFMLSVPSWFIELAADIHHVSIIPVYALTILSWGLIGLAADWLIAGSRSRRKSRARR